MKKILFIAFLLITSIGVFAQKGDFSLLGNFGYQTDFKRVMLGVQGRYNLTDHVRLAPDLMFFFPKDKTPPQKRPKPPKALQKVRNT